MTRVLRFLFTTAAAASLAVCVAVAILWVRSYFTSAGAEDQVSRYIARRQARYTVRSERGRLTLYGPPPMPIGGRLVGKIAGEIAGSPAGETVETLVGRITNDQLLWGAEQVIEVSRPETTAVRLKARPAVREVGPLRAVVWLLMAEGIWQELAPPLLRDLEAPDKFVAVHLLLCSLFDPEGTGSQQEWRGDGSVVFQQDGLRVELRPHGPFHEDRAFGWEPVQSCSVWVDPGQLPAVRARWHRRLDVPIRSVPHAWFVAAAAVPPGLWVGARGLRAWVRRGRRRRGLCAACGYDLRASEGRCPECAAPIGRG